jgi:hypothetical protein
MQFSEKCLLRIGDLEARKIIANDGLRRRYYDTEWEGRGYEDMNPSIWIR